MMIMFVILINSQKPFISTEISFKWKIVYIYSILYIKYILYKRFFFYIIYFISRYSQKSNWFSWNLYLFLCTRDYF